MTDGGSTGNGAGGRERGSITMSISISIVLVDGGGGRTGGGRAGGANGGGGLAGIGGAAALGLLGAACVELTDCFRMCVGTVFRLLLDTYANVHANTTHTTQHAPTAIKTHASNPNPSALSPLGVVRAVALLAAWGAVSP